MNTGSFAVACGLPRLAARRSRFSCLVGKRHAEIFRVSRYLRSSVGRLAGELFGRVAATRWGAGCAGVRLSHITLGPDGRGSHCGMTRGRGVDTSCAGPWSRPCCALLGRLGIHFAPIGGHGRAPWLAPAIATRRWSSCFATIEQGTLWTLWEVNHRTRGRLLGTPNWGGQSGLLRT